MRRIYYGWFVVAMSVLVLMLLVGTSFTAFGLFVVPVSEDLGLKRADINTALIFLNIGNAAVGPFIGRALDRFPVKRIMLIGALCFGGSLITLGLSRSLGLSAFIFALPLAIGLTGGGTLTMTVLIARWFQAQRGRAMALMAIGMSLGGVLVTPAVGFLIHSQGWRMALIISGCVVAALLLLTTLIVRDRPGPNDVESRKAVQPSPGGSSAPLGQPEKIGALLRMPHFWTIALGSALALGVSQGVSITLAPLALGAGLTMIKATGLISAAGGGAMAGKLLLAVVADRVDRIALLSGLFVLVALINIALLLSESYIPLLISAGLLGITTGALTPLFYALLADRFGTASFGTVRGLMMPIVAVVGAASVRFAGEVYDRTESYDLMFYTFIVAQLVAAVFMIATRFVSRPALAANPLRPAGVGG